jgi:pyrroloquinoline quinone (PQQ) biosynthesis protein C
MEHFRSPFTAGDLTGARIIENRAFFKNILDRAQRHRFFSHEFLASIDDVAVSREVVAFILTTFYKIVTPFTGLLCSLGGKAPNLRSRFALMDNIYEEMGCGDLNAAHPSLYMKMLASIGVTEEAAESLPELASIRRINEHLHEVVGRFPFAVASAVLASAEATIPPSFPVMAAMARRAFPEVDMTFFERHGARDEGHSEDASTLFVVTADASQFAMAEAHVWRDLEYRSELFDEWVSAIALQSRTRGSERPFRPSGSSAVPRPRHDPEGEDAFDRSRTDASVGIATAVERRTPA